MNPEQLKELTKKWTGKQIAVVGDIILDRYLYGDVDRISPEAPVPVILVKKKESVLGGAANVAHNLAALGAHPTIVGVIGDDEAGKELQYKLQEKKINCKLIIDSKRPTTEKTRVVSRNQQLVRIDQEDHAEISTEDEDRVLKTLESFSTIIVSDYKKGTITKRIMEHLTNRSKAGSLLLLIDPKPDNKELYRGATVMTPNLKEARDMCGQLDIDSLGSALQEYCPNILITLGAEGMHLAEKGRQSLRLKTRAKEVYDVTGAGDTVIASLALAKAAGASWQEAAFIANIAAGVSVGHFGNYAPSPTELLKAVAGLHNL